MFTGIIQQCGTVIERRDAEHGMTLVIDPGSWSHSPGEGDSIAVNGCCLTVHRRNNGDHRLQFDVIPETLRCTAIGKLKQGDRVHLEHAATPTTLLGGHLVQGHIDGVGEVVSVADDDNEYRLRLRVPPGLSQYIIPKGSIAIDGVSLTIASVGGAMNEVNIFDVALIPATLELTTLGELKPGDSVNIEADYIAKLVVDRAAHSTYSSAAETVPITRSAPLTDILNGKRATLAVIVGVIATIAVSWYCALAIDVFQQKPIQAFSSDGTVAMEVSDWSEIGATCLISDRGLATSKSPHTHLGGSAEQILPAWSGLRQTTQEFTSRDLPRETQWEDARGWPMLSLRAVGTFDVATLTTTNVDFGLGWDLFQPWKIRSYSKPRVLPLRPIWMGFLMDTLLFSCVAYVLATFWILGRDRMRDSKGQCTRCGHRLIASQVVCPECGANRATSQNISSET